MCHPTFKNFSRILCGLFLIGSFLFLLFGCQPEPAHAAFPGQITALTEKLEVDPITGTAVRTIPIEGGFLKIENVGGSYWVVMDEKGTRGNIDICWHRYSKHSEN